MKEPLVENPVARRVPVATSKPIVVERKRYASVAEAARAYELPPAKVRRRLNEGWPIKKAFELE